jgi:hypothetical protein
MRELDVQVVARPGQTPASVRFLQSILEAYSWAVAKSPNEFAREVLGAMVRICST